MDEMMQIEWLGCVAYDEALARQKRLVAERNGAPDRGDKVLLLEHPHTYTVGARGGWQHLLVDEGELRAQGVALHHVGRGGDITYHGPGQLVGYPILNLKRLHASRGFERPDLHLYVREVEEVVIRALAEWGIRGWRYEGYTGVWVDTEKGACKIAAIGIRVSSKGISSHGFAVNVVPDMAYFANIVACGIQGYGVTSMVDLLKRPLLVTDILPAIEKALRQVLCETAGILEYRNY